MNSQEFLQQLGKSPFEAFDKERPLSSQELRTRWQDTKNLGGPLTLQNLDYVGPKGDAFLQQKSISDYLHEENADGVAGLFEFKQLRLSEASPNDLVDLLFLMIVPKEWDFQQRMDAVLTLRDLEKQTSERKEGDGFVCCLMQKQYQDLFNGVVRALRYK